MSNSRKVYSSQHTPHENLENLVKKHLQHVNQAPVSDHSKRAFEKVARQFRGPIIFDSGCGNGFSSRKLAEQFPEALVVGVDKSAARLERHQATPHRPENYQLVRADLADFWRLAREDGVKLYKHFIFYPNPWPKKSHIKRRWQGSPVFPEIIKLGGELEVRSNWHLYIEEFSAALSIAGFNASYRQVVATVDKAVSGFEKKYLASDHELWQLTCNLDK